jgi:hypothetical protein
LVKGVTRFTPTVRAAQRKRFPEIPARKLGK